MFELVELPTGKNVLKNKWVYRVKSEGQEAKTEVQCSVSCEEIRSKEGS
jgi:hypothetical protein